MTRLEFIRQAGERAVNELRIRNLRSGIPFMISSSELPPNQCYLEFPDESISIAQVKEDGKGFFIIRKLNTDELVLVRNQFDLMLPF